MVLHEITEPESRSTSDIESGEKRFSISELAKEFGITTRTIRFYESEGLIDPLRQGNQRIYRQRHRTRLKLILRGKRLGFSLNEIREMFELYDSQPGESAQLKLILEKVEFRKMQLERQLDDVKNMIKEVRDFEAQCIERLHEMDDS